jgi:hypothetical protein
MKPSILIAAVLGLFALVGVVTAQAFLNTIAIVDIKQNGTSTNYFAKHPNLWNFVGAGNASISGTSGTMTIGTHYAPYDPDMGALESKGAQIGSTVAKPTCAAGTRGLVYTLYDAPADGGTKDITYQCCKLGASTYNWVSPTCL